MLLAQMLEQEIKRRGISQREASRQIGVSHTTLVMVKKGRPLEVNTAYLICQWLGVPLTVAVDTISDDDRMLSQLGAIIKTTPGLERALLTAAKEVEKGALSTEDFKEILQFTMFKIQQRREQVLNEEGGDTYSDRRGNTNNT